MNDDQDSGLRFDTEERLPWLEPIEDMPDESGTGLRLFGLVLGGLLAIGLIVGGLWWWQNNASGGNGDVIAASTDPYKVAPTGEQSRFGGDGAAAAAAAQGSPTEAKLDPSRLPEQPVAPPVAGGARAAANATAAAASATAAARPATTPATAAATRPAAAAPAAAANGATAIAGGTTLQLGAFASEASANRAWAGMKARFAWLANANSSVTAAQVNGRTVYRLTHTAANAAAARDICGRLTIAGERCFVQSR